MPTSTPDPIERFHALLARSLEDDKFVKLILGGYRGSQPDLSGVTVRRLTLRGEDCLSFVHRYATRDVTTNLPLTQGLAAVREAMAEGFEHAHLLTREQDVQLAISKKGKPLLRCGKVANAAPAAPAHDREKQRYLDLARPFLAELGVTDAQQRLIPAMARKWKQINKFVEILDGALAASGLAQPGRALKVVDFGCGKAYLTFAVHDHLRHKLSLPAQVTGVELRADLVDFCNAAARRLALEGLAFEQGDVRSHAPGAVDVMIALHACDTATDYAIDAGIRAGASVILCSPCCHKQLRPQMRSPGLLKPLLQHGIHLGQEAEMLTDGLRALLLEAEGYETQVFEFVSLEHTSKNKMILALKRDGTPAHRAELLRQVRELKAFYGVREHCLETLRQCALQDAVEPEQRQAAGE